jgi:hypothetical protein
MFATAMKSIYTTTWNNAKSLSTPDKSGEYEGRLSLFFKCVRGCSDEQIRKYMLKAIDEDIIDATIIAFNVRDCRGGKGERDLGRKLLEYIFEYLSERRNIINKLLTLIPEYGRWDDLLYLLIKDKSPVLILDIISSKLLEDKRLMEEGKPVSLCAKWCPTENDSDDKKYKLVKKICEHMGIHAKTYRTKIIGPLRSYINIVEKLMCSGKWSDIDLNKIPSCAMKKLKKAFEKHIPKIFIEWKNGLKDGTTNVKAKQLYPYEIVKEIREKKYTDEVCEAQWKVLEDEAKKLGYLDKSVAVIDASFSMHDNNFLPYDNAFGLGLLISSVVSGEFHNNVITFADNPCFHLLSDSSIGNRYDELRKIEVGYSTDIQKIFDLILRKGIEYDLSNEDMPEKIFIISDMQFNNNNSIRNVTNFELIEENYEKSGYKRPKIIFWNVNGSSSDFPVSVDDNGTCLVSGFSQSILKSILTTNDFTSVGILKNELNSDRYKIIKEIMI